MVLRKMPFRQRALGVMELTRKSNLFDLVYYHNYISGIASGTLDSMTGIQQVIPALVDGGVCAMLVSFS
jgi:hypothetical protein